MTDQRKDNRKRKNLGTTFSELDFNTRTVLKQGLAVTQKFKTKIIVDSIDFQSQIMSHQIFSYNRASGIVKNRGAEDGIQSVL